MTALKATPTTPTAESTPAGPIGLEVSRPQSEGPPASPGPQAGATTEEAVVLKTTDGSDALALEADGLAYALDRAPHAGKRVVVTVRVVGHDGPAFTDAAPLLAFKGREALATTVAAHFGRSPAQILGHLALLLDQVERAQAALARPVTIELTPERRVAAETLLDAPDVLDRAAATLDALGYVGEDATKRLAYLVATSRLLERPLSAILMAPSGTGKSDLLDKLTLLLPPEAVEFLSRVRARSKTCPRRSQPFTGGAGRSNPP